MTTTIHPDDREALKNAVAHLTSPRLTAKLSDLIGGGIEYALQKLPDGAQETIRAAIMKAAEGALWSLDNTPNKEPSPNLHKLAAGASGSVGGLFGFSALAIGGCFAAAQRDLPGPGNPGRFGSVGKLSLP